MRIVSLMRRASLYWRRCSAHCAISLFSSFTPEPQTHHQIKSFFGKVQLKVAVTMTSNLLSLVPPHQLHIPGCPSPSGHGSPLMAWTHESLTSLTSSGQRMDPVAHKWIECTECSSSCAVEWHYECYITNEYYFRCSLKVNVGQYQSSFFNNVILLSGSGDNFPEVWCIIFGGHNYWIQIGTDLKIREKEKELFYCNTGLIC